MEIKNINVIDIVEMAIRGYGCPCCHQPVYWQYEHDFTRGVDDYLLNIKCASSKEFNKITHINLRVNYRNLYDMSYIGKILEDAGAVHLFACDTVTDEEGAEEEVIMLDVTPTVRDLPYYE